MRSRPVASSTSVQPGSCGRRDRPVGLGRQRPRSRSDVKVWTLGAAARPAGRSPDSGFPANLSRHLDDITERVIAEVIHRTARRQTRSRNQSSSGSRRTAVTAVDGHQQRHLAYPPVHEPARTAARRGRHAGSLRDDVTLGPPDGRRGRPARSDLAGRGAGEGDPSIPAALTWCPRSCGPDGGAGRRQHVAGGTSSLVTATRRGRFVQNAPRPVGPRCRHTGS